MDYVDSGQEGGMGTDQPEVSNVVVMFGVRHSISLEESEGTSERSAKHVCSLCLQQARGRVGQSLSVHFYILQENIMDEVEKWLTSQAADFYGQGIQNLVPYYKCLGVGGGYVKK